MKLILFDIDSTLLKDGGAATAAFHQAFLELFGQPPVRIDKHGLTDQYINRRIAQLTIGRELTAAESQQLHDRYVELFPEYLQASEAFQLLPGSLALCNLLGNDPGLLLGVQTGNLEPAAWAKLRHGGLAHHFRFGGFGEDAEDRARLVGMAIERGQTLAGRSVAARDIFVVGDSVFDIQAGNANGAVAIGVATGRDSTAELLAAGARVAVADLRDTTLLHGILTDTTQAG
jgi:phosphoglycolate phosphatase-like HAD superfamily hydrolase